MLIQLSSAMGYIHSRRLVHRDIKPANILIRQEGPEENQTALKIADFGMNYMYIDTKTCEVSSLECMRKTKQTDTALAPKTPNERSFCACSSFFCSFLNQILSKPNLNYTCHGPDLHIDDNLIARF